MWRIRQLTRVVVKLRYTWRYNSKWTSRKLSNVLAAVLTLAQRGSCPEVSTKTPKCLDQEFWRDWSRVVAESKRTSSLCRCRRR